MALNLYRRHRRECKGGYPENHISSDLDERRKNWRRCECPIFASGTLQGKFRRKSTGQWEWADAKAIAGKWESAANWDGQSSIATAAPQQTAPPLRPPIHDATAAYLSRCQNRAIRPTSFAKYRTFVNQLRAFANDRGYVYLDQFGVADMDAFYGSWKDGIKAKSKKLDRLKSFVKFCVKRKWLAEEITSDLQARAGSSIPFPKAPFTDDELNRIYAACDRFGAPANRNWTGEDAKDFIFLSVYTGLRISDVATFDITKRLDGNNVFLRMHKTQKPIFTWIPDWLADRLRARQGKYGQLIFRCGVSFTMKQLTDIWRGKRINKIFELAGPFEERATPHRFRHTFVRILLEKGVPVADAAELIGDTEDIVRRHYARWVPERQSRLTKILKDAFAEKPKPKLVALPGGRGYESV
jgi:integrase